MNTHKIQNVINLNVEQRYDYFIRKVAEYEEVWGLYENGWALLSDKDKRIIIPFWPEEDFALLCCTEQWANYQPKMISLDDFVNKWLPGMHSDNRYANIFYTPATKIGTVVEPNVLLENLKEEMENYL
jgi:hypothetical protein